MTGVQTCALPILREFLTEEAEELLERRFAIIQVWRPLKTISRNPLAFADARSVPFSDLIVSERRYPHRVGETVDHRGVEVR